MVKSHSHQITVAGALAYDQIAHTPATFDLPQQLNCKLTDLRRELGGCGGNITYNLAQLGLTPRMLSYYGTLDAAPYLNHLAQLGVDTGDCLTVDDTTMASAIILTDAQGTQFTGFYPGHIPTAGQWAAHLRALSNPATALFIQAPFPADLMIAGLSHFKTSTQALTVWAPGQYADQLDRDDIENMLGLTDWLVGNTYEIQCLEQHAALQEQRMVITSGHAPIQIQTPSATVQFDVPPVADLVDPTGCGDALLAGFCAMLALTVKGAASREIELYRQGIELGNMLAARCLVQHGSQHHDGTDLMTLLKQFEQ